MRIHILLLSILTFSCTHSHTLQELLKDKEIRVRLTALHFFLAHTQVISFFRKNFSEVYEKTLTPAFLDSSRKEIQKFLGQSQWIADLKKINKPSYTTSTAISQLRTDEFDKAVTERILTFYGTHKEIFQTIGIQEGTLENQLSEKIKKYLNELPSICFDIYDNVLEDESLKNDIKTSTQNLVLEKSPELNILEILFIIGDSESAKILKEKMYHDWIEKTTKDFFNEHALSIPSSNIADVIKQASRDPRYKSFFNTRLNKLNKEIVEKAAPQGLFSSIAQWFSSSKLSKESLSQGLLAQALFKEALSLGEKKFSWNSFFADNFSLSSLSKVIGGIALGLGLEKTFNLNDITESQLIQWYTDFHHYASIKVFNHLRNILKKMWDGFKNVLPSPSSFENTPFNKFTSESFSDIWKEMEKDSAHTKDVNESLYEAAFQEAQQHNAKTSPPSSPVHSSSSSFANSSSFSIPFSSRTLPLAVSHPIVKTASLDENTEEEIVEEFTSQT